MKRLAVLLFLSVIILLSGCVEQDIPITTTTPKDGVTIKKFWFDSSNIYEEDKAVLNLELQNIGEIEATGISAILFGPSEDQWVSGVQSRPSDPFSLNPSEPEVQMEGESRIIKWTLTAPNVETTIKYNIGTRLSYSYRTVYTGTLRLVEDTYLETLTEQERSALLEKNGIASSKVTGGPLSVNPVKGRNFVISSGVSGNRDVVFELINTANGYPEDYEVGISSWTGFSDCDSYGSRTVTLSKGESRLFKCGYNVPGDIENKEDIIFSVTFGYNYYVDDITSVTVNPLPEL